MYADDTHNPLCHGHLIISSLFFGSFFTWGSRFLLYSNSSTDRSQFFEMRCITTMIMLIVEIQVKIDLPRTVVGISCKRTAPYKQRQMSHITVTVYGNHITERPALKGNFAKVKSFSCSHSGKLLTGILIFEIYPYLLVVS